MKSKNLILIGLMFVILSCNNDDESQQAEINGEYVGIFERGDNNSNVELTFNNGNWSGESEVVKFPALCNGTYSSSGNVIAFENACPWTAEFDWSLILTGEWNYSLDGNSLILTKTNGDKYTLTKQ
ncbi:hypothetical protein RBH94_15485 [Aestuariibaculum sp. YM273]|uniref:hypothetical protein n=1 Tax=Aestuariibaculum sp. YM273 TaxID=3070659 RepID=UPI0027DE7E46|nr:hypothetical protein [Aestuariibaculum sp. YM273]WMI65454.1 hypothetical protein RBH94_15485 [Aestuariibaculum sp. YM273]